MADRSMQVSGPQELRFCTRSNVIAEVIELRTSWHGAMFEVGQYRQG